MRISHHRSLLGVIVVVMLLFSMNQTVNAVSTEPGIIRFQGVITAMNKQYLIVSSRQVDISTSEFKDNKENPIPFSNLAVGKSVEIIGLETKNRRVTAYIIHLLPSMPPS
jgi:hypothetical protein